MSKYAGTLVRVLKPGVTLVIACWCQVRVLSMLPKL
jgi:hypothetical protein